MPGKRRRQCRTTAVSSTGQTSTATTSAATATPDHPCSANQVPRMVVAATAVSAGGVAALISHCSRSRSSCRAKSTARASHTMAARTSRIHESASCPTRCSPMETIPVAITAVPAPGGSFTHQPASPSLAGTRSPMSPQSAAVGGAATATRCPTGKRAPVQRTSPRRPTTAQGRGCRAARDTCHIRASWTGRQRSTPGTTARLPPHRPVTSLLVSDPGRLRHPPWGQVNRHAGHPVALDQHGVAGRQRRRRDQLPAVLPIRVGIYASEPQEGSDGS